MTPPNPSMPFGHALKLGLTQAMSRPWTTLGMGFARTLDGLSGVSASAAIVGGALDHHAAVPALIGVSVVAALVAALLRAILLGAGLTQGAARMREQPCAPFPVALAESARRSFSYALLSLLIDAVARMWLWLAIGTSGWLFVRALLHKQGGVFASLSVAFTLTVGVPLLLATALVVEVAFARAIARGEQYAVAVYEAVGELWARPWKRLALFATWAVIGGVVQFPVNLMVSGLTSSGDPFAPTEWSLMFAGQAVAVILGALVIALFDHARAQSLLALELHAVSPLPLPPPVPATKFIPTAPVIPVAQVIPVAPLVPPPDRGGEGQ